MQFYQKKNINISKLQYLVVLLFLLNTCDNNTRTNSDKDIFEQIDESSVIYSFESNKDSALLYIIKLDSIYSYAATLHKEEMKYKLVIQHVRKSKLSREFSSKQYIITSKNDSIPFFKNGDYLVFFKNEITLGNELIFEIAPNGAVLDCYEGQ